MTFLSVELILQISMLMNSDHSIKIKPKVVQSVYNKSVISVQSADICIMISAFAIGFIKDRVAPCVSTKISIQLLSIVINAIDQSNS